MTKNDRLAITKISKDFALGFKDTIPSIEKSGFLIADPLSAFLNSIGCINILTQLPARNESPQILILTFEDGWQFIPAGSDLKNVHKQAKNWMWLPK